MTAKFKHATVSTLSLLLVAGPAIPQSTPLDPGVQSASRGTGANIIPPTDATGFGQFWGDGRTRFQNVQAVSGSIHNGLGPRFNSDSCVSCHSQPAVGGSGAAVNPQFLFTSNGTAPNDTTPSFITANGPTREARFPFFYEPIGNSGKIRVDTSNPDGGVEDLFTVSGRSDAGACNLAQPDFATAESLGNIIFRIPTPTFGLGLIENLDDSTLLTNQQANLSNSFGISGTFNHSGNDGTISRFGWKAQNKSLLLFAGEASNVEMGVTNSLFPNERPLPEEELLGPPTSVGLPGSCLNLAGVGYPENTPQPLATTNAAVLDDITAFGNFMRFNAPPPTGPVVLNGSTVPAANIADGQSVFNTVGCATCHNPTPGTTQISNFVKELSGVPVNSFSDFEIHDMGSTLADNVSQGGAGGDQFRTAPLWGLGQRIFLLHDGRETSTLNAIQDHASKGSEASTSVSLFNNTLTETQQQDLLDFLRSL
jgi:CxxC motif-containing protein (DUF1111 family)